jgi:hypothetical protein
MQNSVFTAFEIVCREIRCEESYKYLAKNILKKVDSNTNTFNSSVYYKDLSWKENFLDCNTKFKAINFSKGLF